jgi:hypothetical protein
MGGLGLPAENRFPYASKNKLLYSVVCALQNVIAISSPRQSTEQYH